MRILLLNPNIHGPMTEDMDEQARRYARPGTEIEAVTARFGAESVEGHYEEEIAVASMLGSIKERAHDVDGVIIACFGDPGLYAAREISPVPVVGIAEAAMHMACLVAHKFSVVSVIPRIKPMMENTVRFHGLEGRCASVRTTSLTVLDCEADPVRAEQELIRESRLAIDEDGAEAICLGCGGMGPLDRKVSAALGGVPVLDGIACAVKLLESIFDYGLQTSRVAAFKAPEPKKFLEWEEGRAPVPA